MNVKHLLILGAASLAATAQAQVIQGPTFPAPGGTTFSSNGQQAISATGKEGYYSGFTPADFTQLDFTFSSVANPYANSQGGGGTGNMTFGSYDPTTGLATWNSTVNLTWDVAFGGNDGSTVETTATKLVLQFQPYTLSSGQLGSGWLTPTTAGAAGITSLPAAQSVLDVGNLGGGDNFQIWYQFQTASGTPLGTFYNSFNNVGDTLNSGTTGGFFYVVPEPSSVALAGLGGLALLGLRWRK